MPSFIVTAYKNSFICYTIVCIMRTLLVLVAWSVAVLIPEFQFAVSFVGGTFERLIARYCVALH